MATSAAAAAGTSTSTSSSSSQSNYVSGQLKNNVQSRLDYLSDVFLSLSELVAKYDAENRAMKDFIAILLHFKSSSVGWGPDAAILFKADLKQCLAKFNAAAASSPSGLDFVHEKTDYYRAVGTTAYCSYVEDDTVAPVMPPAKRGRFGGGGGGGGEVYSAYRSANHSSSSFATAANESTFSSDRASNASDSEHLEIKVEPDVEIIEPPMHHLRGGGGGGFDANLSGELSDDSSRAAVGSNNNPNNHNHNSMLTAMLDKPITNATSSSSMQVHHRLTRDRNNDLKVTLRKVAKRSMEDYLFGDEEEEEGATRSRTRWGRGPATTPPGSCADDLSEHLKVAHFTNVDFNTFCCLVVGCTERFPNSARATVHMKNVHPEEYITCEQCQKQCSQDCDYVAAYYHELEKHRYMTHNNRYNWVDNGGGGGGGGECSSLNGQQLLERLLPHQSNRGGHHGKSQQQPHNNNSSNGGFNAHLDDHPQSSSVGNLRQPTTTSTSTARRYLCKYPDSNCSYWHESRSRVLQHIRTLHLRGGSLVLEDRAAEYLEVYDFPENSFYD
ncbi:hypothetical protein TYRP_013717 [Tyrophagus putrescentiae]|nr:hypothetical protein TYRP_013717 [Tyrophagus putrescentiae]